MVQHKIDVIAEHSVCLALLPEEALILDAGCRGFMFTEYFRDKGHNVLAIDIDDLIGDYIRVGIGATKGKARISDSADPQARYIIPDPKGGIDVLDIESLEAIMGGKFDLIKLDVEGVEDEILCKANHPMAKQVSVEFHAHCGRQVKGELDTLLSYLSQWYTVHNAVWESKHGAGFNYWDVLLIAK